VQKENDVARVAAPTVPASVSTAATIVAEMIVLRMCAS
jgi:hypothetical protein